MGYFLFFGQKFAGYSAKLVCKMKNMSFWMNDEKNNVSIIEENEKENKEV